MSRALPTAPPAGNSSRRYSLRSRSEGTRSRGLANARKLTERGLSIARAIFGGRWRICGSAWSGLIRRTGGHRGPGLERPDPPDAGDALGRHVVRHSDVNVEPQGRGDLLREEAAER